MAPKTRQNISIATALIILIGIMYALGTVKPGCNPLTWQDVVRGVAPPDAC